MGGAFSVNQTREATYMMRPADLWNKKKPHSGSPGERRVLILAVLALVMTGLR